MDISEGIRTRRSVRRFKPDPIPQEALDAILEAVQWAPSWNNTQCTEIIIVKDASMREQLDAILSKPNAANRSLIEAPVALVVCGRQATSGYYKGEAVTRWGDWMLFDCAVAVQNLCLMAHSLDLGTVIIGYFDHQAVEKMLAVPEGYSVVCVTPLGYPSVRSKGPKRRGVSDFAHLEIFGK